MRLSVFIKKSKECPILSIPDVNNFDAIEDKISAIFWWWFRKIVWEDTLINAKRYWEKYISIKYLDEKKEKIWSLKDMKKGKLFVMCLKVAEENKVDEVKEVVENWKIQFLISNKQKIFEDYYVWMYFNAEKIEEENWLLFTWRIFSVQKWKFNINDSLKLLLNDIYPWYAVSTGYETTKKRIQDFQDAAHKVIIRAQTKPGSISPQLDSNNDDYLVDVRLELTAKKVKSSVKDRIQNIASLNTFRNDILAKAVAWKPFEMTNTNIKASIWGQDVAVSYEENDIICSLKDSKEMKDSDYNTDWFSKECELYFSN